MKRILFAMLALLGGLPVYAQEGQQAPAPAAAAAEAPAGEASPDTAASKEPPLWKRGKLSASDHELQNAVEADDAAAVAALLPEKPKSQLERNLFVTAVVLQKPAVTEYLLRHRPDIVNTRQPFEADHIIFYSVCQGHENMVAVQLAGGVPVTIKDLKGRSLADTAARCNQPAIRELINRYTQ